MAIKRVFATEDGDLNTTSIITARSVAYKDLDLTFTARPGGDIYKKTDAAAVKQAVKNLLLTSTTEKPFQPRFGGNLYGLLFELFSDPVQRTDLRDNIAAQIEAYEPRARVNNVIVLGDPDANEIEVQTYFTVISTNEDVVLETTIQRLR